MDTISVAADFTFDTGATFSGSAACFPDSSSITLVPTMDFDILTTDLPRYRNVSRWFGSEGLVTFR